MSSCLTPNNIFIKAAGHAYLLPCNKCAACLERKKQTWIHRIEQEKLNGSFKHSYFLTLTYNDDFLPFQSFTERKGGTPVCPIETGESLLNPYDLRMFIKRFRLYTGAKCSYFAVGEYGKPDNTRRPHFHIMLFCDLPWNEVCRFTDICWSRLVAESSSARYKRYKLAKKLGHPVKRDSFNLSNRVSFGRTQVRSFTFKRCSYLAKYVSKQFGQSEVVPPFYRASNGLGYGYLNSLECKNNSAQNVHYAYLESGVPVALSRYYSQRMFTREQMDTFSLQMINAESLPLELLDNPQAVKDWYDYKCEVEKSKRRALFFRSNYVRKYS